MAATTMVPVSSASRYPPMGRNPLPACVQALQREGVAYRPLQGERTAVQTVAVWRHADDSPLVCALREYLPCRLPHGRFAMANTGA